MIVAIMLVVGTCTVAYLMCREYSAVKAELDKLESSVSSSEGSGSSDSTTPSTPTAPKS